MRVKTVLKIAVRAILFFCNVSNNFVGLVLHFFGSDQYEYEAAAPLCCEPPTPDRKPRKEF